MFARCLGLMINAKVRYLLMEFIFICRTHPEARTMPKIYQKSGVKTQFPTPKFREFRDNGPRKNAIEFFLYWKRIPDDVHDFIEVRVYQLWPVCDFKITEPDRKTVEKDIIAGTCPFEPEQYRDKFMEMFGSGEWHCVLNEKGVAGAVTECWFSAIDLDRFLPKVDLRCVLPNVHANKEYIRFLRARNVQLPWELPEDVEAKKKEQEDEMATTDALQTMADSNAKLAEKNMDLAERVASANKSDAVPPAEPSLESKAGAATIDMMTHATNGIVDMWAKHAGHQFNPVELMETAFKFARPERPEGESESVRMMTLFVQSMKESNELARSAQREQFEFMKSVTMGKNGDGSFTAVVPAQKSLIEQAKEMKEMSDLFGGFFGGGRRERSAPEPPAEPVKGFAVSLMENIGPITALVTTVGVLLGNMMYNWKLKDGERPQSPQEAMNKSQGAQPDAAPAAQQATQNGPPSPQQWVQWFQTNFANSFLTHLFGGETDGYTLAQLLITNGTMAGESIEGRKIYMTMKENLGPQGLDMLVRGNPPVWKQVSSIPQRYAEFINEFFTYDAQQDQNEPVAEAATAS